jgi:hypothetical protein
MSPSVGQYVGFIVLVVILSGVAIELNRRIEKRRMAEETKRNSAWVQLDVHSETTDEPSPETGSPLNAMSPASTEDDAGDDLADENDVQSMHTRAKQNGHYSESKKPG